MSKPTIYRQDCHLADQFYGAQGTPVRDVLPTDRHYGYCTIPVLTFLTGCEWNDQALSAVLALDPSWIRVTAGECTTDSIFHRITVYVEPDLRTIREIEMSVQVHLFGDLRNGGEYMTSLRKLGAFKPPAEGPLNSPGNI